MFNSELPFTKGAIEKVQRPISITKGTKLLLHTAQLHALWKTDG